MTLPHGTADANATAAAALRSGYAKGIIAIALLIVGAQLAGILSSSRSSSMKLVALGQLNQQQQQVLEHPALAAVASKLDCTAALGRGAKEQYKLNELQLLQYSETGGKPLLLHNHSRAIMGWIMGNEGEAKVHQIFRHLFSTGCDSSKVFVDVGANAGFYSVLALAYGCQVLAFDPQPACAKLLQHNLCLNAHYPSMADGARGVAVVNRPVSDVVGVELAMMAAGTAAEPVCEGTFSVNRQHKSAVDAGAGAAVTASAAAAVAAASFMATAVSLDELLTDSELQLHVVKIDTEGFEMSVMRSMRKLLEAQRVRHIIVEVTPLFWTRDKVAREDVYAEFRRLLELRCTIQRALDVCFADNNASTLLDTDEKLREYLVVRDFVQEDLVVSCPSA